MGNFVVWVVWIVAAFACLGSGARGRHLLEPVLLGARADREPRLARRPLPAASAEFVAAAQVLVYAGAVMVMFLFVIAYLGRHARCAVGRRAELAGARRASPRRARCSWRSSSSIGLEGGRPARRTRRESARLRQPRRDRQALPHRPPARVRDHLDRPARRRGRRRRPRLAARASATTEGGRQ